MTDKKQDKLTLLLNVSISERITELLKNITKPNIENLSKIRKAILISN